MRDFLIRTLTTKIAPMVYLMAFVSVFIGLAFATPWIDSSESVVYASGVLLPAKLWGVLLFVSASTTLAGMIKKISNLIAVGSFACWLLWLLASIEIAAGGHIYVLVSVSLFHLLFYGYVYLANALDILQREEIHKLTRQ